jgi:hypothetical protein
MLDEDDAFDEDGLLKDGHVARVRMSMKDAMSMRDCPRVTDAFGNRPGHKPGFIVSNDARQRDARAQAYADYERDLARAYKDQPPAGAYPYSAAAEGGACTIDGRPGRLVKQGDWLVCKPTTSFNGSANGDDAPDPDLDPELAQSDRRTVADIQKAHSMKMARLYAQRDAELSQQWRCK